MERASAVAQDKENKRKLTGRCTAATSGRLHIHSRFPCRAEDRCAIEISFPSHGMAVFQYSQGRGVHVIFIPWSMQFFYW